MNLTWNKVWTHLMTAIFSASLGFGITMASAVNRVAVHSSQIGYLQKAADELKQQDSINQKETNQHIQALTNLITEQMKQTSELIALIKLQNRIVNP